MLVSAIQQHKPAVVTYTLSPSLASLPSCHPIPLGHTEHQTGLPALHSNFSPAVYLTLDSIHVSMLLSPFVPLLPSPTVSTGPFSPSLELHFFSASRFINIIFLRRSEQIFLQKRHTDGQKTHEKMLSITNY